MRAAALALLFWCAAAAAESPRTTNPTLDWLIEAFERQAPAGPAGRATQPDPPVLPAPTEPIPATELPTLDSRFPRHEPEIEFEVIVDPDAELGGLLETLRRITPLPARATPTSIPRP